MRENDLIRRSDATAHPFANGQYDRANANKDFIKGFESYKEWLENLPAVPQTMGAAEYAKKFALMCGAQTCDKCPFLESERFNAKACVEFERQHPEEAVAIVQKWAAENKT